MELSEIIENLHFYNYIVLSTNSFFEETNDWEDTIKVFDKLIEQRSKEFFNENYSSKEEISLDENFYSIEHFVVTQDFDLLEEYLINQFSIQNKSIIQLLNTQIARVYNNYSKLFDNLHSDIKKYLKHGVDSMDGGKIHFILEFLENLINTYNPKYALKIEKSRFNVENKLKALNDKSNQKKLSHKINGVIFNHSDRFEIANTLLDLDSVIRKLDMPDLEKYKLASIILNCNETTARNLMNGQNQKRTPIHEQEVKEYLDKICR